MDDKPYTRLDILCIIAFGCRRSEVLHPRVIEVPDEVTPGYVEMHRTHLHMIETCQRYGLIVIAVMGLVVALAFWKREIPITGPLIACVVSAATLVRVRREIISQRVLLAAVAGRPLVDADPA